MLLSKQAVRPDEIFRELRLLVKNLLNIFLLSYCLYAYAPSPQQRKPSRPLQVQGVLSAGVQEPEGALQRGGPGLPGMTFRPPGWT